MLYISLVVQTVNEKILLTIEAYCDDYEGDWELGFGEIVRKSVSHTFLLRVAKVTFEDQWMSYTFLFAVDF